MGALWQGGCMKRHANRPVQSPSGLGKGRVDIFAQDSVNCVNMSSGAAMDLNGRGAGHV